MGQRNLFSPVIYRQSKSSDTTHSQLCKGQKVSRYSSQVGIIYAHIQAKKTVDEPIKDDWAMLKRIVVGQRWLDSPASCAISSGELQLTMLVNTRRQERYRPLYRTCTKLMEWSVLYPFRSWFSAINHNSGYSYHDQEDQSGRSDGKHFPSREVGQKTKRRTFGAGQAPALWHNYRYTVTI